MADEIIMYGTTWCPDCVRAKSVFKQLGVTYKWIDIATDAGAAAEVERINKGFKSVPTILFPDGAVLVEPSRVELENKLSQK
ncbi:glutaredoxin domain-containing protein [Dehalogenimonas sp. 4OHTPN]|uniref:Glutaredoxin domain-containing protein n=1 Tax=Dehalogenimonas sp. 4OHTPN TaxID=3166643 RepID=A0AAU8G982_9CHLR